MITERSKVLYETEKASVYDISDGVVELTFHAEDGTIDAATAKWAADTLTAAEGDISGVIITSEGDDFCTGTDVAKIRECAKAKDEQGLKDISASFQSLTTLVKKFAKPVVVVAGGKALDFGAELVICAENLVIADDLAMGFQTKANAFSPMGGGLTEMALKIYEAGMLIPGYDFAPALKRPFAPLFMGMVSKNVADAQKKGLLDAKALVVPGAKAKAQAKSLALYLAGTEVVAQEEAPRSVAVMGFTGAAAMEVALLNSECGLFITSAQRKVGEGISKVLAGGEVPRRSEITEERFLELERSSFVEACLLSENNEVA